MLFADVVGYSTLSERLDPESVHTIMDGCFEILTRDVHRYEGTINQFTGDGVMALLGAPLPTTVQGVLLARIDRLADELKSVLQVAAVIGRLFGHRVLAHAMGSRDEADQALVQLEELEFIYPTSLAPHREFSFKHVLTQQAVYDALLRPKREALHERVGHALEVLHPDYGRLHARQGNVTEARGHLTQALEIFERLGTLIEPDKVRAELAALPTG